MSSFGFGGTNAHVILEEAPAGCAPAACDERPIHILTLSAKTESALEALAGRYEAFLAARPAALGNVCFTANTGRTSFTHRLAIAAENVGQLRERLSAVAAGRAVPGTWRGHVADQSSPASPALPGVVFLFTGQGSQYAGMGQQLYETQPAFREAIERCERLLRPHLDRPLREVLYPNPGAETPLDEAVHVQPALFALEYALSEMWRSWGVKPAAVLGHSLGEYVAACVAGAFSLEAGLGLVVERSRLVHSLPRDGSMAAVFATEARVTAALRPVENEVEIAAFNGPENVVISGRRDAVEGVLARLHAEGVSSRRLDVSHAMHSPLLEPILDRFERQAARLPSGALIVPLVSNLTGKLKAPGEVLDARYWRRHLREAVRFGAGIETLAGQGYRIFLEVGPGSSLLGLGKRCLAHGEGVWLPSLCRGRDNRVVAANSLAELYANGVEVNWAGYHREASRRLGGLPTYPFERQRYWLDAVNDRTGGPSNEVAAPRLSTTGPRQGPECHPLLDHHLDLAHPAGVYVWETELSQGRFPYLGGHRIQGAAVVPMSVYVEMAQAAAAEALGAGRYRLTRLELKKILAEPERGARLVQVFLCPEGQGTAAFQVFSRAEPDPEANGPGRTDWHLHATGTVVAG